MRTLSPGFTGANGMHFITQHQRNNQLKRNHDFVVFNIVASKHKNFLHMFLQTVLLFVNAVVMTDCCDGGGRQNTALALTVYIL